MSRFELRLILLIAIVLGWLVLACSASNLLPLRQAAITSTATRTPKPTFTAPPTATNTLAPSLTPSPSSTPTNTPLPTDTPPPSLTPTETLTPSPTIPPTATRRPPTPRPTNTRVPVPTQTSAPPFSVKIVRGIARCDGFAAVTGTAQHFNKAPYPGVSVGVWSSTWTGAVGISKADGKFDILLSNMPFGEYQVAVVKLETCGEQNGLPTAIDCELLSNTVKVSVTENCNVNRVTELAVYGP